MDADMNAAFNLSKDLVKLPIGIRQMGLNRTGFFWKEDGLFDLSGHEITVRVINKPSEFV